MEKDTNELISLDNLEYSTQLFNFTPTSFVEAIHNGLSEHVQEGLIEFYLKLRRVHPNGHLLNINKPEIVSNIREKFDKYFDKLEQFLRSNITQIPSNVLLPEDSVHRDYPVLKEEVDRKREEIKALEKKLLEAYHVERLLKDEMSEIDKTVDSLMKISSELKQLLGRVQGNESEILKKFSSQTANDCLILKKMSGDILNTDDRNMNDSEN